MVRLKMVLSAPFNKWKRRGCKWNSIQNHGRVMRHSYAWGLKKKRLGPASTLHTRAWAWDFQNTKEVLEKVSIDLFGSNCMKILGKVEKLPSEQRKCGGGVLCRELITWPFRIGAGKNPSNNSPEGIMWLRSSHVYETEWIWNYNPGLLPDPVHSNLQSPFSKRGAKLKFIKFTKWWDLKLFLDVIDAPNLNGIQDSNSLTSSSTGISLW